jgi:hypothetical protein
MIELLQRLKRLDQDGNLMEGVAQLAAKEREVRTLEMAIEYISSLEDEDLARVWPRLMAAIYSSILRNEPRARPKSTLRQSDTSDLLQNCSAPIACR